MLLVFITDLRIYWAIQIWRKIGLSGD